MNSIARELSPRPRTILSDGATVPLPRRVRLRAHGAIDLAAIADLFRVRMAAIDIPVDVADAIDRRPSTSEIAVARDVAVAIDTARVPRAQGYHLRIAADGIDLAGADSAGVFYALATLAQIVERSAGERAPLPTLEIEDAPDFARRGYLLDVSRTKVPTMETLFALVDWIAGLKLNELQLYTEHTFAYRDHATVWSDSSPMTGSEIDALDRHCRARFVELVPNQQSLGHMHRWLKHARYRPLAEVPEGIEHAFSREREPYGLCATDPATLTFLESLYDELLPHFSSARFNVGLDETVDLGLGRSRAACERLGAPRVYLDFVRAVAERVRARGRRMEMWADIALAHPALARDIPSDVHLLEWGYEADHPFAAHGEILAQSGRSFSVCPGTSSWQSIAGRTHNALANLRSAAVQGHATGARGYLITDWGDRGHLQPLSVSYAGIAAGAAFSWNVETAAADDIDLALALDRYAFGDTERTLGRTALRLGDVYRTTGAASTNGSALFFVLAFADLPFPHPRTPGLTSAGLHEALSQITSLRTDLARTRSLRADAAIVLDELGWAADLQAFACRLGLARMAGSTGARVDELDRDVRSELRGDLDPLIEGHARTWLARNRHGGMSESAQWLVRVRDLLGSRE